MNTTSASTGPWQSPPQADATSPAVDAGATAPNRSEMNVDFMGRRGALFWLALKTGVLTILTLGFYRFWMKTRLRRWYWSSIRPGGHPMEYVGDPIEKLLGFFIAVVILTFYIGILNLILMFVSFSVFNSSWLGYIASFAGVIPLWFYATYRARRYVLGRTRWRGVRFGLEKGAWGYAWRALVHWCVTILSLGLLWPRMTFWLEKYRTDRTFFGSARMVQDGHWPMLYRAAIPFIFSVICLGAAALWLLWLAPVFPEGVGSGEDMIGAAEAFLEDRYVDQQWRDPQRLAILPLILFGLLFGAIYYRWVSKRILANHKTAPGIRFASTLSGVRVSFIYIFGNFIAYLILVLGIGLMVMLAFVTFADSSMFLAGVPGGSLLGGLPRWLSLLILGLLYLSVFLMWGVLYQTFVTFPLMRHMARTTSLPDMTGLSQISQRARDEFAEAEGFAEALDLGAAI